jgi:hypothetical protein
MFIVVTVVVVMVVAGAGSVVVWVLLVAAAAEALRCVRTVRPYFPLLYLADTWLTLSDI